MAGSSPATCSAIGSAGIPEMRSAAIRAAGGMWPRQHGGILLPPSITMSSIGRGRAIAGQLFLAAIGPAFLLVALFSIYAMWKFRREFSAPGAGRAHRPQSELLREGR
jgi:TRAP-type C4-dicarboxylate transport system permease large subunit